MTEPVSELADPVLVETHIHASPAVVWNALTDGMDDWWPAEFYTGGDKSACTLHLEARPGGRVHEDYAAGGGLLWGTVVTVVPEQKLQVTGYGFPEWGGPSVWFGTWTLETADDGCLLRFTEHAVGKTSDGYFAEKQKGWTFLFDGALKAHVEGTPAPKWED